MSTPQRRTFRRWLIGAVLIAALASVVAHRAEEREFVHLLERAQPFRLVLALGLQGLTCVAEGRIWRTTVNARVHARAASPGRAPWSTRE